MVGLFVLACGGPAPSPVRPPTASPRSTPVPTATVLPTQVSTPSQLAVESVEPSRTPAGSVKLVIETATGAEDLRYLPSELEAPAGSEITMQLVNKTDPADEIGHNWVLVKPGQEDAVLANGIAAGDDNDWLDTKDPGVIAATHLIEGNEKHQVKFAAPDRGVEHAHPLGPIDAPRGAA
jgi:azurin